MGFGGKSTGRVTKASLWTPALAGSQQMLVDSHQQRASKSLSAPLVVGRGLKKKWYLNFTNLQVNGVQSYWGRKILWPWNSKLQNQSIFLNQGRLLAARTNKYLGSYLRDSLEGLDARCLGCRQFLLGYGNVAEGCPGWGIKAVERLEGHRAWSSCNVVQQSGRHGHGWARRRQGLSGKRRCQHIPMAHFWLSHFYRI